MTWYKEFQASRVPLVAKNLPANTGDAGSIPESIPESGRSPGGGHSNPPQYSCLENPMDRVEPGKLQSMESQGSDTTERLNYSPWSRKESDMTEVT